MFDEKSQNGGCKPTTASGVHPLSETVSVRNGASNQSMLTEHEIIFQLMNQYSNLTFKKQGGCE